MATMRWVGRAVLPVIGVVMGLAFVAGTAALVVALAVCAMGL